MLSARQVLTCKDRRCSNPECPGGKVYYRPVEEVRRVVKGCEYALDVLNFVGEHRVHKGWSLPKVHKALTQNYGVMISERHVGNLLRLYLAMVRCRCLESDVVLAKLRQQGRVILSVDAVRLDDVSPALYVVRELLSGEILTCARIPRADEAALVEFLQPILEIDIPIEAVISDKEHALVAAIRKAFPGVPHQFCQTHYIGNLVKPMESDLAVLGTAVRDIVRQVKQLEKKLPRQAAVVSAAPPLLAFRLPERADSKGLAPDDAPPEMANNSSDTSNPAPQEPKREPPQPGSHSKEQEFVRSLSEICKGLGKSQSGDKLFDPQPLKRYQRLSELAETARRAMEQKGGSWPLLTQFLSILAVLTKWGELARRLERQVEIVRSISRILNVSDSADEVRKRLRAYLDLLTQEAPRRGRGSPRGKFMRHVVSVTERFWQGLFHCYSIVDLPRHNNALEQFFNALKRYERLIHGRKSTAGGPMESFAPYLLELWARLETDPSFGQLLEGLPPGKVREAREELEKQAEPARRRRSLLRQPKAFTDKAVERWLKD